MDESDHVEEYTSTKLLKNTALLASQVTLHIPTTRVEAPEQQHTVTA